MRKLFISTTLALAAFIPASAQWNLPYVRPTNYDFSQMWSPALLIGLKEDPNFLRDEMVRGWTYYKATFQLSNGLINHRRKENGSVIGANEAVSEGQGYGMLLAVLMNDQATFNKIFEAANQFMWRDDHKSYFIWNWPANAQGSATDADLDVGMALVFADELQKKKLWQPYSKSGITYNTRAMDVIRSIRSHMTSQDYLLPGDNWGGDALNNLNPSYFATANLKVFNAYQSEVDFAPVIATCYAVLKKASSQYQKGQAPDWITKDGNRGAKSNNMLDDGIRAPYRIGLDALWFKDPTAIEFCRNSKNTLSSWDNADSRFVLNQMGLYNSDGTLIVNTSALDHIAMWATAVLASGDKAYSQKVLGRDLVLRLVGDKITGGFGSTQLGEIDYYYKQSLGLLGFAAFTGQFPNILADMQGNVVPTAITFSASHSKRTSAEGLTGYTRYGSLLFGILPNSSHTQIQVGASSATLFFSADGRRSGKMLLNAGHSEELESHDGTYLSR